MNYPIFKSSTKIPIIFKGISGSPVPSRFTYRFFADIGFPSSKDREFIPLLKFLNFIDSKGVPNSQYLQLCDSATYKDVLAQHVKISYKEFFDLNTSIGTESDTFIASIVSSLTSCSVIEALDIAKTFKSLCKVCGLDKVGEVSDNEESGESGSNVSGSGRVSLTINVNIPDSASPDTYKEIFKGLGDQVILKLK